MSGRRHRERQATEAEVDLWRRAVGEVAPLKGRARIAMPGPRPEHSPMAADRRVEAARTALPHSSRPAPPLPIDRPTAQRLKNGRMPIDGRIDLHGMTANEARLNLSAFLRASQAMGRRAVLVITGRGLDPDRRGRGVLKREAPQWFSSMSDIVAGYSEADRRHGGAGAFYVRIRRKDKAKHS